MRSVNVRRRENKENAGRPGAQSQSERERADSRGRRDLNAPPERGARPNALSTQPAVLTTASKRALVRYFNIQERVLISHFSRTFATCTRRASLSISRLVSRRHNTRERPEQMKKRRGDVSASLGDQKVLQEPAKQRKFHVVMAVAEGSPKLSRFGRFT